MLSNLPKYLVENIILNGDSLKSPLIKDTELSIFLFD